MIYFTKYAETKFDILNKHKVYLTKEQIEDAVRLPEKIKKKGKNYIAFMDGVAVVCRKEDEAVKVVTFYPIKN
jgi:hypothetical protein